MYGIMTIMITQKLTKLATTTDLRYKTKEIVTHMKTLGTPIAISKGNAYLAVMVSPEYFEKSSFAYEKLMDFVDTKDLEKEMETASDMGIAFEKFVSEKLCVDYVQSYLKETSRKIP
ncbi:hypothetical protein COT49_00645 [candidate division WWE3 bacterium CG08_land_8_20_14_0_20_40_13]|uniref:Antitoxin n=1 Tax=candidate division WWE3 bacterium CG08_land_8_20_14_0_20_40_13 TaxID=1975084 RepID=A0A2H0XEQ0_UNCKA|nr:MAG: hypothetical protein COT49_00645 [candidate division WWE3 bacterium CG08_land_8_20_14_0_20_40_13]